MAQVKLKDVSKIFGKGIAAVDGINLEVADKEFVVLVGPSGSGKSTTLRLIAGLENVTSGNIYIGGKIVNDIPPKDRDIAMVFQNYALYPHMNVYENMSFALRLRKYPRSEINSRVRKTADILGITHLLNREPRELSGGERQRVALGRAIVRKPSVFLFDEPLSNLDAKMRTLMRTELRRLHIRLQSTMIYVTHDQVEAMTLGARIAVMNEGRIQQFDEPLRIYDSPVNKFVAGFIGSPPMNFINGKVVKKDGALFFDEGEFLVKIPSFMQNKLPGYIGREVILGIRPENIYDRLFVSFASSDNTLRAVCEVIEPMGSNNHLHFATQNSSFVAIADSHDRPAIGEYLEIVFDMNKAHFFDKDSGETIV